MFNADESILSYKGMNQQTSERHITFSNTSRFISNNTKQSNNTRLSYKYIPTNNLRRCALIKKKDLNICINKT